MIYNIFGSEDSTDLDVMAFLDKLPSIQQCKELAKEYEDLLKVYTDKEVDFNLCVVSDGVVIDTYKGTNDEINNMLYHTYHNHSQKHPKQVLKTVDRNINIKTARVLRGVLTHFSRTSFRVQIKEVLRNKNAEFQLDLLDLILDNFSSIEIVKHNSNMEVFSKFICFQAGQLFGLFQNKELFTKKEIIETFPSLKDGLYRINSSNEYIRSILKDLLFEIRDYYSDKGLNLIKEN